MKKLKRKITIVLIVFIVLTIGNSFISIRYFNKVQLSIENIVNENDDSIIEIQRIENILKREDREEALKEISKKDLSKLLEINQKAIDNIKEEAKGLANKAMYSTTVILVIIFLIGFFLRKAIKPIEALGEGIKKVLEGDLSYEIKINRKNELSIILEEFNKMVKEIKKYRMLNINQILKEKQRAESIIESIDTPIIVTNSNNNITMINSSLEKNLKITGDEVIDTYFLDSIANEKIFSIIKKSREAINENKYFEDIEIEEGEEKSYYRVIANPIWFNKKENIGTVTLMQDITKFKEIEQMKSDFINTISHELRTPLTSIAMATDMILEDSIDNKEELYEFLNIIKEETSALSKLVTELLDLSKYESGKMTIEMKNINLKEIILGVKNTFKLQLKEKCIQLNVKMPTEVLVKGDMNKISWVLVNLIGNAIRYVEEKGNIDIEVKVLKKCILVSVKDDGQGIEEEYLEKIFQKFVQVKDNNGEITGSSGLGLAICKEIIKGHGGDIWVNSKVSEGSTFFFTLKLAEEQ